MNYQSNIANSSVESEQTVYIGNHYEKTAASGATITKSYYYAGGRRIAMRETTASGTQLSFLLGDHLGSTSVTAGASGARTAELRYKPWGETRYADGETPTTFTFTGQRVESKLGLHFYNSRWYDSALGRFVQADTVVPYPNDPQSWDRFAYVRNNPIRRVDPSGHMDDPFGDVGGISQEEEEYPQEGTYPNDPLVDPEYSTWRRLVQGSPCTACHVTHNIGRIPKNDEIDSHLVAYYRSLDDLSMSVHLAALGGITTQATLSTDISASAVIGKTPWPDPWSGPQTVNGINYSQHALERMAPVGLGGRGIPPSVIENAINFGTSFPTSEPGVVKLIFENVRVIWNIVDEIVVTVIKTGH